MSNKESKFTIGTILNCAFSSKSDTHLCDEPLELTCGHHICKKCFSKTNNYKIIKCKICQKKNERDLNQQSVSQIYYYQLDRYLDDVFQILYVDFNGKFKYCENLKSNCEEIVDMHINYVKEQIEIRIESLKTELDQLGESFNEKLDNIKIEWLNSSKFLKHSQFDMEEMRITLETLKKDIENKENLTHKTVYDYQNKIKELNYMIKELEDNVLLANFDESIASLDSSYIGEIGLLYKRDDYTNQQIIKQIKEKNWQKIDLEANVTPLNMCILPNDRLLFCNYASGKLFLYDSNMKFLKTIASINGENYNIFSLDTNKRNAIYFCAHDKHLIIKTDLEFNKLAIFGRNESNKLSGPCGIQYSNDGIYVCDYLNQCIKKLSEDLVFENSYPLNFKPYYIKIVQNYACIRSDNLSNSIHFYDILNFTEIINYEEHYGVIESSNSYFYEYCAREGMFYCYNSKGKIIEQIEVNFDGFQFCSLLGSIILFGSNLFICNGTNTMIKV